MRLKAILAMTETSKGPCGCMIGVGDEVIVDGLQGRGTVVKRQGRRLTVRYRNGLYVSRDQRAVHSFLDNQYKSQYSSNRSE